MLVIRKSLYNEIMKSINKQNKLQYFKNELIKILERQEEEDKRVSKAIEQYDFIQKSGFGVGTVREWNGKKYRKIAPGKWRRIYTSNERGINVSIGNVKKAINNAKDIKELGEIVSQNIRRFYGDDGKLLPIAQQILDEAKGKQSNFKNSQPKENELDDIFRKYKGDIRIEPFTPGRYFLYIGRNKIDESSSENELKKTIEKIENKREENKIRFKKLAKDNIKDTVASLMQVSQLSEIKLTNEIPLKENAIEMIAKEVLHRADTGKYFEPDSKFIPISFYKEELLNLTKKENLLNLISEIKGSEIKSRKNETEKKEKQDERKAKVKEIAGDGYWNGKIYGSDKNGYSIYVSNKKYIIPEEDYELFGIKKSEKDNSNKERLLERQEIFISDGEIYYPDRKEYVTRITQNGKNYDIVEKIEFIRDRQGTKDFGYDSYDKDTWNNLRSSAVDGKVEKFGKPKKIDSADSVDGYDNKNHENRIKDKIRELHKTEEEKNVEQQETTAKNDKDKAKQKAIDSLPKEVLNIIQSEIKNLAAKPYSSAERMKKERFRNEFNPELIKVAKENGISPRAIYFKLIDEFYS